jgi:hypothetical protein
MADQVWLDYSLARPTDAQLLGANTFGVCRYLSVVNSLTTKKIIWQAEYDHLLELGVAVHLNYEWYEGRMSEGNAAGQIDGTTAFSQARALGYPQGLPITFSDDTSGTALTAIYDYLTGVKTGLSGYYRIGYYGPRVKLDAVLTSGHAVFGWQPTAWSGGLISDKAHLYQLFGGAPIAGTDLNRVLREPPFPWYAGGPDMTITQADANLIADAVFNRDGHIQNYGNPADFVSLGTWSSQINTRLKKLNDDTADQIAAAVVAALPANPGGGATPAEVETAVRAVLTNAFITPPAP